jgi:hypothetical protein
MVSRPQKKVRLNELDCKQEVLLKENDEGQVLHPSPPASKLPGYMAGNLLVENIQHRDRGEDNLLRENIRGAIRQLLQDCAREEQVADGGPSLDNAKATGWFDYHADRRRQKHTVVLWLIPPLLDPGAHFIVVCPFTVLLDQQFEVAQKHSLQAVKYGDGDIPRVVQILFVQVKHVGCRKFCK